MLRNANTLYLYVIHYEINTHYAFALCWSQGQYVSSLIMCHFLFQLGKSARFKPSKMESLDEMEINVIEDDGK